MQASDKVLWTTLITVIVGVGVYLYYEYLEWREFGVDTTAIVIRVDQVANLDAESGPHLQLLNIVYQYYDSKGISRQGNTGRNGDVLCGLANPRKGDIVNIQYLRHKPEESICTGE